MDLARIEPLEKFHTAAPVIEGWKRWCCMNRVFGPAYDQVRPIFFGVLSEGRSQS